MTNVGPSFWGSGANYSAVKLSCMFPGNTLDLSQNASGLGTNNSTPPGSIIQGGSYIEEPLTLEVGQWGYANAQYNRFVGEDATFECLVEGFIGTGRPSGGTNNLFGSVASPAYPCRFSVNGQQGAINRMSFSINGVTTEKLLDFFSGARHHVAFVFRAATLTIDAYLDGLLAATGTMNDGQSGGSTSMGSGWGPSGTNGGCYVRFYGVRITKLALYTGPTYVVPATLPPYV